jgi:uncharacterized protein YjbJ (UPF0337 family)
MNREQFEGNWHLLKGKIKEKWGKLTDDDITRINGKYEQFVGTLQKKYGYTKEQAERESSAWNNENQREQGQGYNPREEKHGNGPKQYSSGSGCDSCKNKQEKDKFKDNDQRDKKRKAG